STGHLVLAFYYYPTSNCSASTCQLDVGYSSSTNGGATWTSTSQLAGPMNLSWLANTTLGVMVGDYISTSFAGGTAFPVFMVASAPTGSMFQESAFTVAPGLTARYGRNTSSGDHVLTGSSSVPASTALTSR